MGSFLPDEGSFVVDTARGAQFRHPGEKRDVLCVEAHQIGGVSTQLHQPVNDRVDRVDANGVQPGERWGAIKRDGIDLGVLAGGDVELFDLHAGIGFAHDLYEGRIGRAIKRADLYQLRINGRTRRWDVDSYAGGAVVDCGGLRVGDPADVGGLGVQVDGVDQHLVDAGSAV